MGLKEIRSFDYAVLLCANLAETRTFYKDVMGFPVETDRENWVSFRVGVTLLTLRTRGRIRREAATGPQRRGPLPCNWPFACHHRP
ncbi:hypothetical protein GCM10029992_35770 [Glycomyces albus]